MIIKRAKVKLAEFKGLVSRVAQMLRSRGRVIAQLMRRGIALSQHGGMR